MSTMALLTDQYRRHPSLQCQDCLKAIYQAEWGCEHLITDEKRMDDCLAREWESTPADAACPLVEPLGEHFARVHIAAARAQGLRRETLLRLFLHAAGIRRGDSGHFSDALSCVVRMAREGLLPFPPAEAEACIRAYREQGCPAVHHSEAFRQHEHPAYRVIDQDSARLMPVLLRIDQLLREKSHVIIAIDGRCASGKTTLAALLAELYQAPVLHMDDFFLQPHQRTPERFAQPGGNVDAERFLAEALTPLRQAKPFAYRPYSCHEGRLLDPVAMGTYPLAIVEGSYSLHPLLEDCYDLRLFMSIDPQTQRARLLARDGDAMLARFIGEWIPLEERYFEATGIASRCDLTIGEY
ncbi:MAG: uridine kinase [Aristaeellaceae bacterium]